MIEVAYGEMILSLHLGCMGDDSSGRVVGGVDMLSPMLDIPGSTPVWAHCILFSGFSYYTKLIIYIWFSKNYTLYKRTLVVSDLVLARQGSENVFDRPLSFPNKCYITTDKFSYVLKRLI